MSSTFSYSLRLYKSNRPPTMMQLLLPTHLRVQYWHCILTSNNLVVFVDCAKLLPHPSFKPLKNILLSHSTRQLGKPVSETCSAPRKNSTSAYTVHRNSHRLLRLIHSPDPSLSTLSSTWPFSRIAITECRCRLCIWQNLDLTLLFFSTIWTLCTTKESSQQKAVFSLKRKLPGLTDKAILSDVARGKSQKRKAKKAGSTIPPHNCTANSSPSFLSMLLHTLLSSFLGGAFPLPLGDIFAERYKRQFAHIYLLDLARVPDATPNGSPSQLHRTTFHAGVNQLPVRISTD